MEVVSFTDVRNSFKAVIDRVVNDNDATLIHRRDGENAVLVSEAAYNSMMETMHLLSSPANARALLKAVAQDKKGQSKAQGAGVREIHFVPDGWAAYVWWQGQDRKTLKRINLLIEAATRDPFEGIGKPEPLIGNLSGYWSRRIDDTNRLVYRVTDDAIIVVACRYHYGD